MPCASPLRNLQEEEVDAAHWLHMCPSGVPGEESESLKGKFVPWKPDRDKPFHQTSLQLLFITLASACAWQCQHSVFGKYLLPVENTHIHTNIHKCTHTHMLRKGKKGKKRKAANNKQKLCRIQNVFTEWFPPRHFSSSFPCCQLQKARGHCC